MTALELILDFPFLQRALLGALAVAVLSGVIGVFVVLRGLSLLGDGLAHISFAGIAIGVVVGFYPLGVALAFAVAGALTIHTLRSRGIVSGDTAIGILFTAGLALGVLVLSASGGLGVGVHAYLFGTLLAITATDLVVLAAAAAVLLVLVTLLSKELFFVTFSEEAARLAGLPVGALNVLFMAATASAIVVASRVVGVLLVSALLVVPAASALQIAQSFRSAVMLSVGFGVASVLVGVYAALEFGVATGASIALASTVLFAASATSRRLVTKRRRASGS